MSSCPLAIPRGLPVFESEECIAYGVLLSGPWPREVVDVESLLVNDDGSELFYSVCSETVDAGRYSHGHSLYGVIKLGQMLFGRMGARSGRRSVLDELLDPLGLYGGVRNEALRRDRP